MDTVSSILFGRCFVWKRVANGGKNGTFFDAVWGMFLDMVIFLKLMTVSNGMLTFARSGVPKMLPKIDKNWCQKTIPSFDEFFYQKLLPQAPQSAPKMDQKSIKNRCLGPLGAKRATQIHVWSIFDRFWMPFGAKRSFKCDQNWSNMRDFQPCGAQEPPIWPLERNQIK